MRFQKFRRENTLKRGKAYRTVSEPDDLADNVTSNPEYFYSVREARGILLAAIDRVPEVYREALQLRILEDLTYDEIAQRLKLPVNTVSTKIHKAKKLLANILKERGLAEVSDF